LICTISELVENKGVFFFCWTGDFICFAHFGSFPSFSTDLWSSHHFTVVWRGFIPAMNGIGMILSLIVITYHLLLKLHPPPHKRPTPVVSLIYLSNNSIMLLISIINAVSFIFRLVYCALGAWYSTTNQSLLAHALLLHVSCGLESVTSILAAVLFMRWADVTPSSLRGRIENQAVVCCVIMTSVPFAFGGWLYSGSTPLHTVIVVELLLIQAQHVFATVVYIFYGILFLRILSDTGSSPSLPR
jgi:hypothetical protein